MRDAFLFFGGVPVVPKNAILHIHLLFVGDTDSRTGGPSDVISPS